MSQYELRLESLKLALQTGEDGEKLMSRVRRIEEYLGAPGEGPPEPLSKEDVAEKTTPGKRGRPKKQAPMEPPPVDNDHVEEGSTLFEEPAKEEVAENDWLSETPAPEVKKLTTDDVRKALVALQLKVDDKASRKILTSIGGAESLATLKPEKFQKVIDAANQAAAAAKGKKQ